jgi:signal peptidase I
MRSLLISPEFACMPLNLHEKEPMEVLPQYDSNPDQAAAPGTELNPAPPAPAPTPPRKAGGLKLWLRDILISVVIAVLIIVFLYQPVRVEGTSMLPRLDDQDRLFINKFVYRFTAIERGDVVVFHYPRDPEKSYIKRVIALPGDRLRIDHGTVWINGLQQTEPYVPEEYRDSVSYPEIIVPADSYFMMGDHRCISSDSRSFGPVAHSFIYGKAVFVLWPASDAGTVR